MGGVVDSEVDEVEVEGEGSKGAGNKRLTVYHNIGDAALQERHIMLAENIPKIMQLRRTLSTMRPSSSKVWQTRDLPCQSLTVWKKSINYLQ